MERDMFSETHKRQRIGQMLFVSTRKGVGGIVPNHAPHERRFIVSQAERGWHLHLTVKTLRTWDGMRTLSFDVSLHPSERRRKRLQSSYQREER